MKKPSGLISKNTGKMVLRASGGTRKSIRRRTQPGDSIKTPGASSLDFLVSLESGVFNQSFICLFFAPSGGK